MEEEVEDGKGGGGLMNNCCIIRRTCMEACLLSEINGHAFSAVILLCLQFCLIQTGFSPEMVLVQFWSVLLFMTPAPPKPLASLPSTPLFVSFSFTLLWHEDSLRLLIFMMYYRFQSDLLLIARCTACYFSYFWCVSGSFSVLSQAFLYGRKH